MFPAIDSVTNEQPLDEFRRKWYTEHLLAAGESQWTIDHGERYRFTWLRTFENPIICRIERGDGGTQLIGKRLSGQGGYDPGTIAKSVSRELSNREWHQLLDLLKQMGFWSSSPESAVGCDGAQWILEGAQAGQYHLWDLWSPQDSGWPATFVEFGLRCIALAGFSISERETY